MTEKEQNQALLSGIWDMASIIERESDSFNQVAWLEKEQDTSDIAVIKDRAFTLSFFAEKVEERLKVWQKKQKMVSQFNPN